MDLFKVIAEMNGEGQSFVIPRLYVELTGGHTEALVFKQLVFWSNKTTRTDGFFYKKSEELEAETMLTRRQIDGIVKKLINKELIEVERKKANGAPTRHFKINQTLVMTRLHEMVQSNARNGANLGLHETVQSITDSNNRQDTTDSVVSSADKPEEINVFNEFEKRWGIIPSAAILSLNAHLDEGYEPGLIVAMMDYAVKKGKRLNYGMSTMDRIESEYGIKTLAAYQAHLEKSKVQPIRKAGGDKHGTNGRQSGVSKNDEGTTKPRDYLSEEVERRIAQGGWSGVNDSEFDF